MKAFRILCMKLLFELTDSAFKIIIQFLCAYEYDKINMELSRPSKDSGQQMFTVYVYTSTHANE